MGQVISIWGSPNSGKTTFSIKLAKELSKEKSVMIVFTDLVAPVIPTIMNIADNTKSLGNILSAPILTEDYILRNCLSVENVKNIGVIGYTEYENFFTYPHYAEDRSIEFINTIKELADYVIIDITSSFHNDLLSATALEYSDNIIRLITPNLKDISYFNSQLPLLDSRFNIDGHINVLSKYKEYDAVDELVEVYKIKEKFAYIEEVREQSLCSELFISLSNKEEVKVSSMLKRIIDFITPQSDNEEKLSKFNFINKLFMKGKKLNYESSR